ncbi:MAG: prolyl oligopeptidase family serine peptidase [Phycisphaerae bacterium]|nr:prolyl oligopeptidase family serine peptidase [Phycisphaerae bacterium]
MRFRSLAVLGVYACAVSSLLGAETLPFVFENALTVSQIGRSARSPIRFDAVEHQIVTGAFAAPTDGAPITAPDGTVQAWGTLKAVAKGDFPEFADPRLNGGYLFATFESDEDRSALLEAQGHSMVYVNGEPRIGDPYSYGWLRIPVVLKKGRNDFLFACGRGRLQARLTPCPSDGPFLLAADDTLPDLVAGEDNDLPLGLAVAVPTAAQLLNATLEVRSPEGTVTSTPLPSLLGSTASKVAAQVKCRPNAPGPIALDVTLKVDGQVVAQRSVEAVAVGPHDRRKITFRSGIDGSVQYYSCVPASGEGQVGLILSLHGASVEATSQAASYSPKSWAHIICPTNRRPFGFDWEDWGRLDALEALADAQRRFNTDPRRQWLTGHSMGGHGTWQLGSHFPDRFAAIAPSAGWISFSSYGGVTLATEGAEWMFARASSASDTLALKSNLAHFGIYILHGDIDDNVPVAQARRMRSELASGETAFHSDFVYFEKRGANHWWGSECVDWPPLMAFLAERTLPEAKAVDSISFSTAAPSVSSTCHWLAVDQQITAWATSSVQVALDRLKRSISGTTGNVARLRLSPPIEAGPLAVTLDNTTVETTLGADGVLWLVREGDAWKVGEAPAPASKRAERSGAFKDAIGRDLVIVYGTAGDEADDAALRAKARFDAETFWYRGNGSLDVIADIDFEPSRYADRSVLLIGNAETNGAWNGLLGGAPILVRNGSVKVGDRELAGDDLACLFAYPRRDSDVAYVAAVAGTGRTGTLLTMRVPYFVSGVGYPDLCVLHASTLLSGAAGFRAAGFFGNDWSVEKGDWATSPNP